MSALEASALGRRYHKTWALRDCTFSLPEGSVAALVGPNGAGKSTLMNLAMGLVSPTSGEIRVLGSERPGSPAARAAVSFVAQDTPLYTNLSVTDTFRMGRALSLRWDQARAEQHIAALGIPMDRKVGQLSGGQHAQIALAVALARRPDLLILDEPVARLDPVARHDFMGALMGAVAEDGITVLLSSHVVSELERVSDHLIVLGRGEVQLCGDVDELLAEHRVLSGPTATADAAGAAVAVVDQQRASKQTQIIARVRATHRPLPAGWESSPVNLEELVLAYLRAPNARSLPGPRLTEAVPA